MDQVVSQLSRLSKDSLAQGLLDQLGEEIFTTAKVRKALDRLFAEPQGPLLRLIRKAIPEDTITPKQIQQSLARIWRGGQIKLVGGGETVREAKRQRGLTRGGARDYGEAHHIQGKPQEVLELYRALDRFCQDLAPGQVARKHLAKYVSWSRGKWIFCCAHLLQSGLRVWVKLDPREISESAKYARDVSNIGHWGVGDVEFAIDSIERLRDAQRFIRAAFEAAPRE